MKKEEAARLINEHLDRYVEGEGTRLLMPYGLDNPEWKKGHRRDTCPLCQVSAEQEKQGRTFCSQCVKFPITGRMRCVTFRNMVNRKHPWEVKLDWINELRVNLDKWIEIGGDEDG